MKKWWMFQNFIKFECCMFSYYYSGIELNFQTFAIGLLFYRWVCCEVTDDRQPFRTLISFKRKMDKYHFIGGNMSQSCLSWFHIRSQEKIHHSLLTVMNRNLGKIFKHSQFLHSYRSVSYKILDNSSTFIIFEFCLEET